MAQLKNNCIMFFESYWKAICDFDEVVQAHVLRAMVEYGIYGREIPLASLENALFQLIKPIIDKTNQRWQGVEESDNAVGKGKHSRKGKEKNKKEKESPTESKRMCATVLPEAEHTQPSSRTSDDNAEQSGIAEPLPTSPSRPSRAKFAPPSVEEVQNYCREQGLRADARRFVDFYESKGWMVGNTPMRNWQASLRKWQDNAFAPAAPQPQRAVIEGELSRRQYTDEELASLFTPLEED